jgi:hypothetical protein
MAYRNLRNPIVPQGIIELFALLLKKENVKLVHIICIFIELVFVL